MCSSSQQSERNKNSKKRIVKLHVGRVFVNVVSLKYIGYDIHKSVGEMCLIPVKEHD